jgi:hypothetical protein
MKKCAICKKPVRADESQSHPAEYNFGICHLNCATKKRKPPLNEADKAIKL